MDRLPDVSRNAPAGGSRPGGAGSPISAGTVPPAGAQAVDPLGCDLPASGEVTEMSFAITGTVTSAAPGTDPAIEMLALGDVAKKAAYDLKKAHPAVNFTSGRRNKQEQASAMASNVVLNRVWITQTYVPSEARDACQKWLDQNKDKTSKADITAGLAAVINGLTDAQLAHLSKHLSGDAFDVQPVTQDAEAIKATIQGLQGLSRFLEKEGGLIRWHAQF